MKKEKKTTVAVETVEQRKTKVINIYKGISTEERIKLYLRLCDYVLQGEELK